MTHMKLSSKHKQLLHSYIHETIQISTISTRHSIGIIKHHDVDRWRVLVKPFRVNFSRKIFVWFGIGAMGAMNLFGIGTNKDTARGIECLRQASERGNIYVSK